MNMTWQEVDALLAGIVSNIKRNITPGGPAVLAGKPWKDNEEAVRAYREAYADAMADALGEIEKWISDDPEES